jgi:hybrid cluster-associated redox disulfide protein
MAKKITAKTKFDEIMHINPEAGMILFEHGMHCVGCGMASMETLEQGCLAHGMEKKEIKELIERLNKK